MAADRADQYVSTEKVLDETPDAALVSNLGVASYVLTSVAPDRARNFYQWGSMGVTTGVGLGFALSTDEQVTVFEGDGSLLMSLGVLSTVGCYDPNNLTVVLWNNAVYGTTGGQSTHSPHVGFEGLQTPAEWIQSRFTDAFAAAYAAAVELEGTTLIICHIDPVNPDARPPFDFPYIARRARNSLTGDN